MALGNSAGQYGAVAVYYGGSGAPFTRWPAGLGGDLNGINAFMIGKGTYNTLPLRSTIVYSNVSLGPAGGFAARLNGGGGIGNGIVPCRVGPMPAFIDTTFFYGSIW